LLDDGHGRLLIDEKRRAAPRFGTRQPPIVPQARTGLAPTVHRPRQGCVARVRYRAAKRRSQQAQLKRTAYPPLFVPERNFPTPHSPEKNMSPKKILAATLALSLAAASAAHAEDGFNSRFSGFGTIGYAATDTDDVLLTNPGQLKGARRHGSALVDSRLGGQLDLSFNPALSATVQAIAMQDAQGKFMPQLKLAFLRYKLSDSVAVRLGRLSLPAYLVSDYRYVGYANPWVRAPLEVYTMASLDSYEGADVVWTHGVGDGYLSAQLVGGHVSAALPDNDEHTARVKANQLAAAYLTYEIGGLRVRGGYSSSKVTYLSDGTNALFGGLRLAGFERTANAFESDNDRLSFTSFGANYDADNLLLTGEYAKLRSDARMIGNATGWYGTFGYRLGKWMPYVTYGGYSKTDERVDNDVPAYGQLIPLSMGLDQMAASKSQHTASLGLKVDVRSNVAFKAQVDHVRPSRNGGTFSAVAPGFDGSAVNVYSAVVDFVF
jgi:hypothetical protein